MNGREVFAYNNAQALDLQNWTSNTCGVSLIKQPDAIVLSLYLQNCIFINFRILNNDVLEFIYILKLVILLIFAPTVEKITAEIELFTLDLVFNRLQEVEEESYASTFFFLGRLILYKSL